MRGIQQVSARLGEERDMSIRAPKCLHMLETHRHINAQFSLPFAETEVRTSCVSLSIQVVKGKQPRILPSCLPVVLADPSTRDNSTKGSPFPAAVALRTICRSAVTTGASKCARFSAFSKEFVQTWTTMLT
jgi:hypothetical protein